MKKLKLLFVASLLFTAHVSIAQKSANLENSILWKIEHSSLEKPSYLFGTLHIICEEDFIIPEKVLSSLDKVEELVLEINLLDPEEMKAMQNIMVQSTPISEDLSQEEFAKLDTFIQKIMGSPLQVFDSYGISNLYSMTMFTMLPCTKLKYMEMELIQIAAEKEIKINSLEKVSEQFSYMKKAYPAQESYRQIFLYDEYKKDFNDAIEFYLKENMSETVNLIAQDKYMTSNAVEALLTNRNKKWVDKMRNIMQKRSNLFAVGAAHLVGEYGVIQLLREKGFSVTPVL